MPQLGIFSHAKETNNFAMPLFRVSSYDSDSEDCLVGCDTLSVLGGKAHFMMLSVVLNGRMIDK
jgi:hypothetical protein